MLSATYTIDDVKTKLRQTYDYWDYTSDAAYEAELTSVSEDVERLYFIPRIGEDAYDIVAAKDRSGLTTSETNLYWAEVYTICYEFLKFAITTSSALSTSSEESLSVEGYSYKTKSSSGASSSSNISLKHYFDKMSKYWGLYGWNVTSLQRTCTIFGDGDYATDGDDIIE